MADDELEVVSAIYCQPGEVCISKGSDGSSRVTVRLRLPVMAGAAESSFLQADLVLHIPSAYPSRAPDISVCSDHLNRNQTAQIRTLLCEKASENLDQPMLMDLISLALEQLDKMVKDAENTGRTACVAVSGDIKQEDQFSQGDNEERLVVLHLDHMRAKAQYVKLITKWAGELSLAGCVLFCQRLIVILLQGPTSAVKEYIVRQRSSNVDVDSRGQPCKERMLSVVCDTAVCQHHFRFKDFNTVELNSAEDIKEFFLKHNLEDIFLNSVRTLKHFPRR